MGTYTESFEGQSVLKKEHLAILGQLILLQRKIDNSHTNECVTSLLLLQHLIMGF